MLMLIRRKERMRILHCHAPIPYALCHLVTVIELIQIGIEYTNNPTKHGQIQSYAFRSFSRPSLIQVGNFLLQPFPIQ